MFEPEPTQYQQHSGIEPERLRRQVRQACLDYLPDRQDRPIRAIVRQGPGGAGGRGNRGSHRQAAGHDAGMDIGKQRSLAAEQVRDRRDIDQQPVGLVERRPWPPALRPDRQPF
jgi:hypothetical protein